MDIVQSIWISSLTGAGLFFSAGMLLRDALPRRSQRGPDEGALRRSEESIAALGRAHHEATRALAEERQRAGSLEQQLARDGEVRAQQQQEIARLGELVGRLQAEAIKLRAAAEKPADHKPLLDDIRRLHAKLAELTAVAEAERARADRLDVDLAGSRSQARAAEERVTALAGEIDAARERARRAEEHAAAAGREMEGVRAVCRRAEERSGALAQELAASRAACRAAEERAIVAERAALSAEGRARKAEERAAAAGREVEFARERTRKAEERAEAIARDLASAKADLGAAAGELRAARAEVAGLQAKADEVARLREDNGALRIRVEQLAREASGGADLAEVQRRNMELTVRSRVLDQRQGELARAVAENEELRRRLADARPILEEVEALRDRVRDLEAQGWAARARAAGPSAGRAPSPYEQLEAELEGHLASIMAGDGARAAVLSDASGLLMAAAGEGALREELGAASSLVALTVDRLRDMFPFGEPLAAAIVDQNRIVYRTRWLHAGEEAFLLSTFGVTADPEHGLPDRARAILAALARSG